jgi:hypothetical protein
MFRFAGDAARRAQRVGHRLAERPVAGGITADQEIRVEAAEAPSGDLRPKGCRKEIERWLVGAKGAERARLIAPQERRLPGEA